MKTFFIFLTLMMLHCSTWAKSGQIVEYTFSLEMGTQSTYTDAYVYGTDHAVLTVENPGSSNPILRNLVMVSSTLTNIGNSGTGTYTMSDVTAFRSHAVFGNLVILRVQNDDFVLNFSNNTVRYPRRFGSLMSKNVAMTVKSIPAKDYVQAGSSQVWPLNSPYPVQLNSLVSK